MGYFNAYLSRPLAETVSLLELIEHKSVSSKILIELMIKSGDVLNEMHQSGFIHRDFNLQHVIYHTKEKTIQLIGREQALPLDGECSVGNFLTSPGHFHPEWWMNSRTEYIQKGVVIYTPKNDVYAYLHSAEYCLSQIQEGELDPQYQQRIVQAKSRLTEWKSMPFNALPPLEDVVHFLGCLTREPQVILCDKMAGLNLYRKKINS